MDNPLNTLQNNHLASLTQNAPKSVMQAIQTASAKTGVNFSYLVEKAAAESNFDTDAKAKTSSATGLFQFIESTWIDMVERHAPWLLGLTYSPRRPAPTVMFFMTPPLVSQNHYKKFITFSIKNSRQMITEQKH